MSPDNSPRPLYPPDYAFVMQLRADVSLATGQIGGRIEHVVSGSVAHFASWEHVLAFMAGVLNGMDDDCAHDRPE